MDTTQNNTSLVATEAPGLPVSPGIAAEAGMQIADPTQTAVVAAEMARLRAGYMMAASYPRNEEQARRKLLSACQRPKFAEKALYKKPVKKKEFITGLSVRFMEEALRLWGNINTETSVVFEDEMTRKTKVLMTDIETRASYSRIISVVKTVERKSSEGRTVLSARKNSWGDTVYTVVATDDELQNKENALISKVIRNEGGRLLPADLKEECEEQIRATLEGKAAENPADAMRKVIDAFATLNIMPADLEQYLNHPVSIVSPKEIADLRSIYQGIKDKETTWAACIDKDEGSRGETERKQQSDDLKKKGEAAKKAAAKKKKAAEKKASSAKAQDSPESPDEKDPPSEDSTSPEQYPTALIFPGDAGAPLEVQCPSLQGEPMPSVECEACNILKTEGCPVWRKA